MNGALLNKKSYLAHANKSSFLETSRALIKGPMSPRMLWVPGVQNHFTIIEGHDFMKLMVPIKDKGSRYERLCKSHFEALEIMVLFHTKIYPG